MKIIVVLLLCSHFCISQESIYDTIYLNPNYRSVNLTAEQEVLIAHEYSSLKQTLPPDNTGEAMMRASHKANLYAYSLLEDNQKVLFEISWKESTLRLMHSYHHHLFLSDEQKESLIEILKSEEGFDTLMITTHSHFTDREDVLPMLDSTQLVLDAEHQNQIRVNFERAMAESDPEKARDTAFERQRLEFVRNYSIKHLQKEKRHVTGKIKVIKMEDAAMIDEITGFYYTQLESEHQKELKKCYSLEAKLIAPNQKILLDYRYKRFEWQPNLCVYWCFNLGKSAESKEEEEIVQRLEYLMKTYGDILNKSLLKLKKRRAKLNARIESARPPIKSRAGITIVAESRIQALEESAELILVRL